MAVLSQGLPPEDMVHGPGLVLAHPRETKPESADIVRLIIVVVFPVLLQLVTMGFQAALVIGVDVTSTWSHRLSTMGLYQSKLMPLNALTDYRQWASYQFEMSLLIKRSHRLSTIWLWIHRS